jgi:hypothetical protein
MPGGSKESVSSALGTGLEAGGPCLCARFFEQKKRHNEEASHGSLGFAPEEPPRKRGIESAGIPAFSSTFLARKRGELGRNGKNGSERGKRADSL